MLAKQDNITFQTFTITRNISRSKQISKVVFLWISLSNELKLPSCKPIAFWNYSISQKNSQSLLLFLFLDVSESHNLATLIYKYFGKIELKFKSFRLWKYSFFCNIFGILNRHLLKANCFSWLLDGWKISYICYL